MTADWYPIPAFVKQGLNTLLCRWLELCSLPILRAVSGTNWDAMLSALPGKKHLSLPPSPSWCYQSLWLFCNQLIKCLLTKCASNTWRYETSKLLDVSHNNVILSPMCDGRQVRACVCLQTCPDVSRVDQLPSMLDHKMATINCFHTECLILHIDTDRPCK